MPSINNISASANSSSTSVNKAICMSLAYPIKKEILSDKHHYFANSNILFVDPTTHKVQVSTVAVTKAPLMKFFVNHLATEAIMDTGA